MTTDDNKIHLANNKPPFTVYSDIPYGPTLMSQAAGPSHLPYKRTIVLEARRWFGGIRCRRKYTEKKTPSSLSFTDTIITTSFSISVRYHYGVLSKDYRQSASCGQPGSGARNIVSVVVVII